MCLSTLEFGAAQLRSKHRSYSWTEALSAMVFVPAQKLSDIVWTYISNIDSVYLKICYWKMRQILQPKCNLRDVQSFAKRLE